MVGRQSHSVYIVIMTYAVEINNLNKTYKAQGKAKEKVALRDVSLQIPKGCVFGLLGPNGAGKSTLINIMAGLVIKSSGDVKIWGRDIDVNPRNARVSIGIVPQEINFDPFFTPRQILDLQAGMYGVPKAERRTAELLELVGIADKADSYTRSLSGGMKRRLMVAKAMVHSPPVLVLDEPSAGVDIELRRQLWKNVRMLNEQGVTVLLTTHYLEEAEEMCDKIAIINNGEVVVCKEKDELLSSLEGKEITFTLDRDMGSVPGDLQKCCTEQKTLRKIMVRYNPSEQQVGDFVSALQNAGYGIVDISTTESDLEDVFLQLTAS